MTTPGEMTVRVEGLDRLVRTLKKAGRDIADLTDAHARAARRVTADAAARAPRVSGKLAASIRPAKQARRARIMAGRAAVPYAAPIHWGWPSRHIAAQTFISDAARATEPEWAADYRRDVEAALANVKGD